MRRSAVAVVLFAGLVLLGWPLPAEAAVSIDRAELKDSDLRVEGDDAVADARILIDGVDRGSADDRGRFRIEVAGFSSPTCRISVDDGTGAVEVDLDDCTPTESGETDEPTVSGLILDPTSVTAGDASAGSVLLSGPAPSGGASVALASSDPEVATVPPDVTVAAGDTAGSFAVSTHPVETTSSVTISATSGSVTDSAALTVTPAGVTVSSVSLNPDTVTGGAGSQATVTLTDPAPSGGASAALASSDPEVATVPPDVTVAAGDTAGSFAVSTHPVDTTSSVTISASYGGVTRSATLTVMPEGGTLESLTIDPDTVIGGETAEGTVSLTEVEDTDTEVTLTSTDTSVATVPATLTVPAGATSGVFPVTTHEVSGTGTFAVITGSAGGVERGASISVNPGAAEDAPAVVGVTFAPSSTGGGGASTGTAALDAPATDGAVLSLSSGAPDVVSVPQEVVVAVNDSSVEFPVTTTAVDAATDVTITATANCCGATGSQTGTMTVTTDAPPPPDTVGIKDAELKECILSVRATSTNPNAIVTVHLTSSGSELMRLDNKGDGRYEGERAFRPPGTDEPVSITVQSNFGGSETTVVADPKAGRCRADL